MTKQGLYELLNEIAPTHYSHAPIGQTLPFITYTVSHTDNFGADDKVFVQVMSVTVTLYMGADDLQLEEELNDALREAYIYWTSDSDYDETNKLFTTIYDMEVIEHG